MPRKTKVASKPTASANTPSPKDIREALLEAAAYAGDQVGGVVSGFYTNGFRTPSLERKLERDEALEISEAVTTAVKDAIYAVMQSRGL